MNNPLFLAHLLISAKWKGKKVQRQEDHTGAGCNRHPGRYFICYLNRTYHVLLTNLYPGIDLRWKRGYLIPQFPACTCAVSQLPSQPVTELLVRWRAGDQDALERLIPVVYRELRQIAHYHLQRERPGHTLQSAALVHEAYLRLLDQKPFEAESRTHFLAVASRLMRQILVDYARGHTAAKRGAELQVDFDAALVVCQERSGELVALDEALNQLSQIDEQQSRIVEMRFFGGLSIEEISDVLGLSRSTVKREWNVAKAWLSRQMKRGAHGEGPAVAEG